MVYANWDFYNRVWHGELTAQEFERWSSRASLEMDRVTHGRAAGAPNTMTDALAPMLLRIGGSNVQAGSGRERKLWWSSGQ